jgi:hypothetical protein
MPVFSSQIVCPACRGLRHFAPALSRHGRWGNEKRLRHVFGTSPNSWMTCKERTEWIESFVPLSLADRTHTLHLHCGLLRLAPSASVRIRPWTGQKTALVAVWCSIPHVLSHTQAEATIRGTLDPELPLLMMNEWRL